MNERKIGQRINAALAANKMKQKELAKTLGVTDNTISYFCGGTRTPKIEQLVQISKALGVTTDYLLCLTDDPSPNPCAVDELGLSAEAIQKILDLQPTANGSARFAMPKDALSIVNWIICNINNDFLLIYLSNLSKQAKEHQSKLDRKDDFEWYSVCSDSEDKLDLAKYRVSKTLDKLLDRYIADYCLHSIEDVAWEVVSDGNN